ncbi:Malate/L-lactate dehydrogenase [Paracoccus halophilus]|uniref:Malate/L-lactate dehydrogenase n=1 Tax=Paracoccus halophilus TaxID=376733 RepID=A0A1I0TN50_9RHOB|nr:Ldh family oxidoreductase [Paracoccus halophilus]SFA53175.1 Malate/L-lactate dehydrogenase [Paracoccus halophilus]
MSGELLASGLIADVVSLFRAAGVPGIAARITAEDLVAAELEAMPSHGVMLVPMYLDRLRNGSISAEAEGQIVSARGACTVLDAGNALGQPIARKSVALAVESARAHGIGAVAVRNANHMGALGLYGRMMADAGCIGLATTNTRPLLPAPGGAEAQTGNNPLAIVAPSSGGFHAEVDMALSAASMGKIRNAAAAGQALPENWATDAEGAPTTDPTAAIRGMLLPAAGPKGFGLALLLDLMRYARKLVTLDQAAA